MAKKSRKRGKPQSDALTDEEKKLLGPALAAARRAADAQNEAAGRINEIVAALRMGPRKGMTLDLSKLEWVPENNEDS